MKCEKTFSGKNKKNSVNFSSAKLSQRVVKVNLSPAEAGYTLPLQTM